MPGAGVEVSEPTSGEVEMPYNEGDILSAWVFSKTWNQFGENDLAEDVFWMTSEQVEKYMEQVIEYVEDFGDRTYGLSDGHWFVWSDGDFEMVQTDEQAPNVLLVKLEFYVYDPYEFWHCVGDDLCEYDPADFEFGVFCTTMDQGLCDPDCKACMWSWPKDDPEECHSELGACRCNPDWYFVEDWTFIKDCTGLCGDGCNDCRWSWAYGDFLNCGSATGYCRCADDADNWYDGNALVDLNVAPSPKVIAF